MSSVIDERIVQMQFDNDKFEKGVTETLESLNKLDNNLNNFGKNNSYFSSLEKGLDNLTEKFSASGMIINGILLSLGQRIEQVLNRSFSKLTSVIRSGMGEYETQLGSTQTILANVKDEGKGIEEVTAALDDLNRYADLTIYNFTEMTRNIGLFTAAGSSLNDSVSAIKGLANAAAIAGVNSQAASRAWYQVSQAMSQGSFRLMDWRSLENAGIAGEQFKRVLEMVAKADGVAIDSLKKKFGGFRNTLQSGWLTAQRFTEAMRIFSGEVTAADLKAKGFNDREIAELQDIAKTAIAAATEVKTFTQLIDTLKEAVGSGWAQSFRTIFGDFEEAKEWLTGISNRLNDFIGEIADIRNDLLSLIFDSGKGIDKGSESMHNIVDNILTTFTTAFRAIRTGFMNIFPIDRVKTAAQNALNFVEKVTGEFVVNEKNVLDSMYAQGAPQKVIDEYKASVDAIDQITNDASQYSQDIINTPIQNLMRFGRGVASVFDGIITTVKDIFTTLFSFIPGSENFIDNIDKGNKSILGTLGDIGDFLTKFYYVFIKNGKVIPRVLTVIKNKIVELFNTNPLLISLKNAFIIVKESVKMIFSYLKSVDISPFDLLIGSFRLLEGVVSEVFNGIKSVFEKITGYISDKADGLNFSFLETAVKNIIGFVTILGELGKGTITFADVLDMVKAKFEELKNTIIHSKFGVAVSKAFDSVKKEFKKFENVVNQFVRNNPIFSAIDTKNGPIIGIITTLAALTTGVIAIFVKIFKGAKNMWDIMQNISNVLASVSEVLNAFALSLKMEAFEKAVNNVLKLAAALLILSLVPYDYLIKGMTALGVVALIAMGLFKTFSSATNGIAEILKSSADKATKGLAVFAKGVNDFLSKAGTSLILEAFSDAILKVAIAFIALGAAFAINPEGMKKAAVAITAITIAMGALGVLLSKMAATNGIKSSKNIFGALKQFALLAGIAVVISSIAKSVMILSLSMIALSYSMGPNLFSAFVTVIALISALGVATGILMRVAKGMKSGSLFGLAAVFLAIASSIVILVKALEMLDKMHFSFKNNGTQLLALGLILSAFTGMMVLIQKTYKSGSEKSVLAFTLMIATIVGGMAIMALSLKQLNGVKINPSVIIALISSLAVLAGLPITLMALIKNTTLTEKSGKVDAIFNLAIMIGTIAGGMAAIILSLKLLDGVDISSKAVAVIISSLAAISGISITIMALLRNAKISTNQIGLVYAFSVFIGSIAGSILLAAVSLKVLDGVTINPKVFGLFIGMLSVIGILSILMGVLVAFSPNTQIGPIVAFSAFIGAFGLTMLMFATALKMLEGVNIGTGVLIALGIMVGAVSLLTALVAGVSIAIAAIPGIGEIALAAIASLGAVIVGIGITILAFAAALYLLPIAVNGILDTIVRLYNGMVYITQHIEEIKENISNFAKVAGELGPIIYQLFFALGTAFGSGLAGLLLGLAAMSQGIAFGIYTFIITILQEVTKLLNENGEEVIQTLHDLILAVFEFGMDALEMVMTEMLPQMLSRLMSFGASLVSSFFELGTGMADTLLEGIGTLIPGLSGVTDDIQEGLGWLASGVSDVADYVQTTFNNISDHVSHKDKEMTSSHGNSMKSMSKSTDANMKAMSDSVEENMDEMTEDTSTGMSGIVSTFGSGTSKVLGFITSNLSSIKNMNKEELKDMIKSKAEEWGISGDMVDKATDLISGYVSDMTGSNIQNAEDEKVATVNAAWEEYAYRTSILKQYNKVATNAYRNYKDIADNYDKMMSSIGSGDAVGQDNARRALEGALGRAKTTFDTFNNMAKKARQEADDALKEYKLKRQELWDEGSDSADTSISDIFSGLADDWKNFELPGMDTSGFNYTSSVDNKGLSKDLKNADKIAADAGKDIENSRADLTPVVDLDKLSSDLKKANGLAQSTLLAAQNAAIGAYINTDSELNPFLKDRYQSVYNFTQNNFSPKALSRIDIYRQTQRQLALSRGF